MADRRRYLITYDIRNAGRLRHVHDVVVDYGERLQYSVYLCDLTKLELIRFKRDVQPEMDLDVDALSIFDLGAPKGPASIAVEHLGTSPVLPETEAEVW